MQQTKPIDIAALSPVERMALADVLYDSAMQEVDAQQASDEELAEIDRRIARLNGGMESRVVWEHVYERLMFGR